ncbi:MAG: hypothetical protein ABJZ55_14800 [Fuerstiella sp.]
MANDTKESTDTESDGQLVDLVSYLDGELPDDEAESVERQLTSDSVLRSDADILSRTWAMLDSLDEVSGSRQFTQSTLQVVSQEAKSQPVTRQVRSFRLLKLLAKHHVLPLFLLGALCAATGLWVVQSANDRRSAKSEELAADQIVLQDFDMLQNLELYQRVPDADVLKGLKLKTEQGSAERSTVQDVTEKESQ